MRTEHKREYHIPRGSSEIKDTESDAVVYLSERQPGRPIAMGFSGKAQKPAFHISFRSEANRARHIDEFFRARRASLKFKAEQKAERLSQGRGLEVGDVLRSSWGYDQTNIDYYEVTAVIGKRMVEVQEIGSENVEYTGYMTGKSVPRPGAYIGKARRLMAHKGSVKVSNCAWAYKMETEIEGVQTYRASNWTAYA